MNWKKYDIPEDSFDLLQELTKDVDPREVMWLLERAADDADKLIHQEEIKVLCHKEFNRKPEEAKSRETILRLTRDIRILGCIRNILFMKSMKSFGDDVAAMFSSKKKVEND
jgi:hypothetical protein